MAFNYSRGLDTPASYPNRLFRILLTGFVRCAAVGDILWRWRFLPHLFLSINYKSSFDANLKKKKNKQMQINCPELHLRQIKTQSCLCTRCDGVWGSGDTDPLVLNFHTRRVDWSASYHCHHTPAEDPQSRCRHCLECNQQSVCVIVPSRSD